MTIWTLSTIAMIPFSVFIDAHNRHRSQPIIVSFWAACGNSLEWYVTHRDENKDVTEDYTMLLF